MLDDVPVDDGSDKPIGYLSDDAELIVREENGVRGYHETALGQERRWQRQAPDLYANWMSLVEKHREMEEAYGDKFRGLQYQHSALFSRFEIQTAIHEGEKKAWSHARQQIETDLRALAVAIRNQHGPEAWAAAMVDQVANDFPK